MNQEPFELETEVAQYKFQSFIYWVITSTH